MPGKSHGQRSPADYSPWATESRTRLSDLSTACYVCFTKIFYIKKKKVLQAPRARVGEQLTLELHVHKWEPRSAPTAPPGVPPSPCPNPQQTVWITNKALPLSPDLASESFSTRSPRWLLPIRQGRGWCSPQGLTTHAVQHEAPDAGQAISGLGWAPWLARCLRQSQ